MNSAERQGKLWGAEARDWAELTEPDNIPVWRAMLDSAGVGAGTRFLDIGCGGGGASVLAAARRATVAGVDPAPELIEIASERVPAGDFRRGDMEALPFSDGSQDVVFASLSIMFAASLLNALRDMKRVAVPGGKVTVSIFGQAEDCEYRYVLQAIGKLMPAPPSGGGLFALSGPGVLEGHLEDAGLSVVDSGEVDAPFHYDGPEHLWRKVRSAGPPQAAIAIAGEVTVREAVLLAAKPFRSVQGDYLMRNRFRFVTASA
jgi:SAM-dependent methyltransferase